MVGFVNIGFGNIVSAEKNRGNDQSRFRADQTAGTKRQGYGDGY